MHEDVEGEIVPGRLQDQVPPGVHRRGQEDGEQRGIWHPDYSTAMRSYSQPVQRYCIRRTLQGEGRKEEEKNLTEEAR
jgi:hypothetical protein